MIVFPFNVVAVCYMWNKNNYWMISIIFLILCFKCYMLYFQLWIRLKMSKKKKVSEENGKSIFGIEFAPFLIPLGIFYYFGFIGMNHNLTPFVLHIFLPPFKKKKTIRKIQKIVIHPKIFVSYIGPLISFLVEILLDVYSFRVSQILTFNIFCIQKA